MRARRGWQPTLAVFVATTLLLCSRITPSECTVLSVTIAGSDVNNTVCSAAMPCASLRHALFVADAVNASQPIVSIAIGPGIFDSSSCNAAGHRPVNITGAGKSATVIDCALTAPGVLLLAWTVSVSDLTIRNAYLHGTGVDDDQQRGGGAAIMIAQPDGLWQQATVHVARIAVIGSLVHETYCSGGGLFIGFAVPVGSVPDPAPVDVTVVDCDFHNNTSPVICACSLSLPPSFLTAM